VSPKWGSLEEANRGALGDGWELAESYFSLHVSAARRVSAAAGRSPAHSDQATILLTCHGLNLFTECTSLIVRGLFDVSAYLLRPMMDNQSLLFACASREELAERYLNDDLKASEARKLLIAYLRRADSALADETDLQLKDDADAANDLSHVGLIHADKLIRVDANGLTPVGGGMTDPREARNQSKVSLLQEHQLLVSLKAFRKSALGEEWLQDFDKTSLLFHEHMKS
jgi:hypothetical protein